MEVDDSIASKKTDDELRKTILNAPRRISKIESSIAKHEVEIKKIDDEMITVSCYVRSVERALVTVGPPIKHYANALYAFLPRSRVSYLIMPSVLFYAVKEGRNRGKLYDLQKSKDEIQVKVDKLYAEYEGLLELIE
jgi:hypothetical protein